MNYFKFVEFSKCTELRTTPIDQYYMGVGLFRILKKCIELVLKIKKVRTTPFDQYFLAICKNQKVRWSRVVLARGSKPAQNVKILIFGSPWYFFNPMEHKN